MKKNIVEDVPYIFNSNLFILLLLACVNLSGMSESMNSKKKNQNMKICIEQGKSMRSGW